MKEKERKFLLKYMPDLTVGRTEEIEQGYLMIGDGKQLRIRIIDKQDGWFCYKTYIDSTTRDEFEYLIPIQDAVLLMSSTKQKLFKTRHKLKWGKYDVDIDVYDELDLMTVEIEGDDVDSLTEFPPYFGVEITGIKKYSNSSLANKK
ncbi:MAG: hypothetical protein HC836_32975 [Richelia sp. RM2_1_2]|nr:hypothetical protein [Richelia sp. RM2_1_2]